MNLGKKGKLAIAALGVAAMVGLLVVLALPNLAELIAQGETRELRPSQADDSARSAPRPQIFLLTFDGVGRELLYEQLRSGELPGLSSLLGGRGSRGDLPHAHLDETLLSTLPSTTMAAWATVMTGATPAEHGVTGNEYFIRETRTFAAPAPVTFTKASPSIRIYTEDYANDLLSASTVWEQMRRKHPGVVIWSSMLPFYAGADLLLTANRTVLASAFEAFLAAATDEHSALRPVYAELDEEALENVLEELGERAVPDVLSVYVPGIDLYAHQAERGPDVARRSYLREVIDPWLGKLARRLSEKGALAERWIVVTSDHGHTDVLHDHAHALETEGPDEPPEVLRQAGFRVRPFELEVDAGADFQAVLAYQGAMAFVYLADRSTCAAPGSVCDWSQPPRYEDDVLGVAEAFYAASLQGASVPALQGTLHLVLARRPRPVPEVDLPFEVYVGGGELVPIEDYVAAHPEPRYVALAARLKDLAVGPHGERAGDVLLLAHNGDRDHASERYYFAPRYRSWHGSPSRRDSEVPLILARSDRTAKELRELVAEVLGEAPRQQKVTDLLLQLQPAGERSPSRQR